MNKEVDIQLKNFIDGLINSFEKSDQEMINNNYHEQVNALVNNRYFANPEEYNIMISYQFDKILKESIKRIHPNLDKSQLSKYLFIYKNYSFLEQSIRFIMVKNEGYTCCADKSRWIIKKYMNYIITQEKLDIEELRTHYYVPNNGSFEDWMGFCNSIYEMRYGDFKNYLTYLQKLIINK